MKTIFNQNDTAIYKLPGKGERTDHIDVTLGATKITIVFSDEQKTRMFLIEWRIFL